ncbi:cupin domain-containing protein [Lentisphaerota bacterium ZTH]|nr:cupin domain-containing protein [Lentisphaerota bacterium]WET06972.1 cupin domain-containing protein [Lentisphaerota bacterium ZTH]
MESSKLKSEEVIDLLNLKPLEFEGGYFNELYRSQVASSKDNRSCGTSIYYMLRGDDISHWHMVTSDEIWYYHLGCPAKQLIITPERKIIQRIIGPELKEGQVLQSVIPAGSWQAAVTINSSPFSWGLFAAAVFPAFCYDDFTAATPIEMCVKFPEHSDKIRLLYQ